MAVVRDAPFAAEDTLYSGTAGRAELIVPNQTRVRIGNSTHPRYCRLGRDVSKPAKDGVIQLGRELVKHRVLVRMGQPPHGVITVHFDERIIPPAL